VCEASVIGPLAGTLNPALALGAVTAGFKPFTEFQAGQTQADIADANAKAADMRAGYAEQAGGAEAGRVRSEGTKVIGEQRAALAANGVDVSSGSAVNLFSSTRAASELDAQQARVNGALDAWGYRQQADTQRAQAQLARRNSVLGPLGGLIGTGASLLRLGG
jgi:hypothetical protein